jgi:hypothetical protein
MSLAFSLTLRATDDIAVRKALVGSCAVCDVGHLLGVWYAKKMEGEGGFWDIRRWSSDDWVNLGILWVGLSLRVGFCAGVGM